MAKNDLLIRIGADDSQFIKKMKRLNNVMVKTAAKMQEIGNNMARNITAPIVAAGVGAVAATAKIDKMKKGLEGLMGSAEAANIEFEKLRKVGRDPGMSLEAAAAASVRLQAIGFSADQARVSMQVLGNAIALVGGTGDDLKGVALAISQIIGKGKVQAEEINQIAERLPQVRKEMQEAFGTADTEAIQKMGLGAEEFVGKLIKEMAKLPKAEKSFADVLVNIKEDVTLLASEIGTFLIPIITKFSGFLQGLTERFRGLSPEGKKTAIMIAGIAAAIGPVLIILGALIKSFAILGTVIGVITSPITLVVAAIALIGATALYVYDNWEAVVERFPILFKKLYNFSVKWGSKVMNAFLLPIKKLGDLLGLEIGHINYELFQVDVEEPQKKFKGLGEYLTAIKGKLFGVTSEVKDLDKALDLSSLDGLIGVGGKGVGGGAGEPVGRSNVSAPAKLDGGVMSGEFLKSFDEVVYKAESTADRVGRAMGEPFERDIPKQVDSFADKFARTFDSLSDTIGAFWAKWGKGITDAVNFASQAFNQYIDNKKARLEANYEREKSYIDNLDISEEQRAKKMVALDNKVAAERRKILRKEAIGNKAKAIFDATIAGSVAVAQNLANPVMAAIIGGLATAQVGFIAAQPLPALAKGGLLKGESVVRAGEYQGATFNPEVYAPLDKLKAMLGGGMGGNMSVSIRPGLRISGRELEMFIDDAKVSRNRMTY